jgi:hypothetical protein
MTSEQISGMWTERVGISLQVLRTTQKLRMSISRTSFEPSILRRLVKFGVPYNAVTLYKTCV